MILQNFIDLVSLTNQMILPADFKATHKTIQKQQPKSQYMLKLYLCVNRIRKYFTKTVSSRGNELLKSVFLYQYDQNNTRKSFKTSRLKVFLSISCNFWVLLIHL